ncbi:MAG: Na/Pi symporter, partial [Flavobacteriales bacterium]
MLNQGVWTFLAGLALFLYAVSGIESSVKGLAGRSFKKFLFRQTSQPVRAVFGGAVVTAFLQSSSVVLLITLSFVGAGILPIRSALALSLGANLGTTFDSWLIAWLGFKFDIESFSFPILALSLLLRLAGSRRPVLLEWARFLFSIALLFLSLAFMKSSIDPKGAEHSLLGISTWSSYVFVPVGFLLTAVIQSSFATMTIGLAALDGGVLGLMQAACLVLGAEAGTAVKFLFSWRSDTIEARRMSLGNLFINLVTVMIGLVIVATSGLTSLSSFFPADPLYLLVA